jgi:hypothetical protein
MGETHKMTIGARAGERLLLSALLLIGLALAGRLELYDVISVPVRLLLATLSAAVSFGLMWLGLRLLTSARANLALAAAWGIMGWSVIPFSQFPYIGYLLTAIEISFGAIFAGFRAGIPVSRAVLPVTLARLAGLGAVVGVRAIFFWEASGADGW